MLHQVDICPYCDKHLTPGGVEFGGYILHKECYNQLQEDMHGMCDYLNPEPEDLEVNNKDFLFKEQEKVF